MNDLILGIHTSHTSPIITNKKKRELHDAIKEDVDKFGLNAVQIFTHGPRLPTENKLDYEKINKVSHDLDVTVHSPYTTVGLWKIQSDNKNDSVSKRKITQLKSQLLAVKKAGGWCMVVHITKTLPENIAYTMKLIKPIVKKIGVKISLEMVASKADREKTYETPEKLDNLITLLGIKEKYYCITVDTAHIWAAGVDVRSYEAMNDWINRMTFKKKIEMFHLNGSFSERGSGKDKHAVPFSTNDKIWHGIDPNKSGVKAVIDFARSNNITIICEINRGTEEEIFNGLNIIKKLGGVD